MIQYARSRYYYNNMFIIYLFRHHSDFINFLVFNPEKMTERWPFVVVDSLLIAAPIVCGCLVFCVWSLLYNATLSVFFLVLQSSR